MKKFTLFLLTALFAVSTTFAQQLPSKKGTPDYLKPFTSRTAPLNAYETIQVQNVKKDARSLQRQQQKTSFRRHASRNLAPHKAPTIIRDTPEGEEKLFAISYDAYVYTFFGLMQTQEIGAVARFVFAEDGSVYWKDPMSNVAQGIWIQGTQSGSNITFELPQCMIYYDSYGYGLNYSVLSLDPETATYVLAENQTVVFSYVDGQLSLADEFDGSKAIGLSYTDDLAWAGYAMWNLSFESVDAAPVEVPENIETTSYAVTGTDQDGSSLSYALTVGFSGSDIYIQGLYPSMPEAWVKGTIEGDKAVFPIQYIGADTHFQFLMPASVEQTYDEEYDENYAVVSITEGDIVFNYDATTKTLTSTAPFMVNAGTSQVNYSVVYATATILPFTEVAATPANPEWVSIYDGGLSYFNAGYGWGYLQFKVSNVDVDGNFILPEKTAYQIYTKTNGVVKPLTFKNTDYQQMEADEMTEFSLDYADGWDFYVSGNEHSVYYYVLGPEAYGVQAIYRGLDEERRSDIVWMDVEGMAAEVQPDIVDAEYPAVDPENVGASITYSLFTGNENFSQFGSSKAESYDVAMKIDNPELVGTKIESISIPLLTKDNISNISAWISTQLVVDENGNNRPNLATRKILQLGLEEGYNTAKLTTPYTIPEEGVYVGYSFTVKSIADEDDENNAPIFLVEGGEHNTLFIHTSGSITKWLDFSELLGASAAIQLEVSGKDIKSNAATVAASPIYAKTGDPIAASFKILNYGANGVTSFDVTYSVNGQSGSQHIDLGEDEAIDAFFGKSAEVSLDIPAIETAGSYTFELNVTKVNGADNEAAVTSAQTSLTVMDVLPIHRPVLEEYTGTWCGWCPRGFVGLEKMNELLGKDFVGISYHNSDPMEIMPASYFPSEVAGFPDAWLDRVKETDAYTGDNSSTEFGVDQVYAERAKVFGVADIQVASTWNDTEDAISVTATAMFPAGYDESNPYVFSFVLVENGLTGEGSDWAQSNYYKNYPGQWPEDLDQFMYGEGYVEGLVFNDVAVAVSDYAGYGVAGSLPETLNPGGSADYTYEFALADVVNTSGENLVQDKNQLYVVAMVIDATTGEVVNAIKEKVGQSSIVGINTTASAFDAGKTAEYFDAAGRRISTPQRGINFKKVTYSDGTQRVIKTLVK